MSTFTEAEHAIAITDTLKWINALPVTPREYYEYGCYHLRLRDYNEALKWLLMAADYKIENAYFLIAQIIRLNLIDESFFTVLPDANELYEKTYTYISQLLEANHVDSENIYRLAYMYRYGLGTLSNLDKAYTLFQQVVDMHADLTPEQFNISCDYSVAGSDIAKPTDACKLPLGAALFELALYDLEGLNGHTKDIKKARQTLIRAFNAHCSDALFLDYEIAGKDSLNYEYMLDIKQLYSYRIGLYSRVCDINPSKKSYLNMIQMYENGYPGDTGQRKENFAKKAIPLYKKMEAVR